MKHDYQFNQADVSPCSNLATKIVGMAGLPSLGRSPDSSEDYCHRGRPLAILGFARLAGLLARDMIRLTVAGLFVL